MEARVQFWSQALGLTINRPNNSTSPYGGLQGGVGGLQRHLPRVHDTSRIHLDIDTDDVEAEVQRLEALGTRRKAQVETWWVMEDPCGHLFCMVPMHSPNCLAASHVWEA
jgi:hypothetical protein